MGRAWLCPLLVAALSAATLAQWPVIYDGSPASKGPVFERARAEGMQVFAEATAAVATAPELSRPEYYSYIGHQEIQGGDPADAVLSLQVAFAAAKALPAKGFALQIKREVEPDAVESLIEAGEVSEAVTLGFSADAARGEIAGSLVGAELARGATKLAWRIWSQLSVKARTFPFRAASVLVEYNGIGPAQRARLEAAADTAVAEITNPEMATLAMDYLEAAATAGAPPLTTAAATRTVAARLSNLDGAEWERRAIYERAAKLVQLLDVEHPLPQFRPSAVRLHSPHSAEPEDAARSPASDLIPVTSYRQYRTLWAMVGHQVDPRYVPPHVRPASRLSAQATAAAPSFVARYAHDYYCRGDADDARALMVRALDAVDASARGPRAPNVIDYDGEPFWVYGLAAQINFQLARARAEALPAGWFKPLALAHVARMAIVASGNRPGHCLRVLY